MELMLGTNISGTDSDSDGLPDYYESHIPIYNGGYMMTNTTLRDTDGDSLADGEEILISRQYIPMTNNVRVTAIMRSDPRDENSDGDGIIDCKDKVPLRVNERLELSGNYISVLNNNSLSYGGAQEWFDSNTTIKNEV